MPKITNLGTPRAFPVHSTKKHVEIPRGGSVEMSADDWGRIKDRPSIKAGLDAKTLIVEGDEGKPTETKLSAKTTKKGTSVAAAAATAAAATATVADAN